MKVGIYGAGRGGEFLFEILTKRGIKVDFFIDQYKNDKEFLGIPVYQLQKAPKDAVIYISVPSYPINIPISLKGYIPNTYIFENLGFKSVKTFDEILKIFPEFYKNLLKKINTRLEKIPLQILEELQLLFKDQKSLENLEKLAHFRENPSYENYPYPEKDFQYFPDFIREIFKEKPIHFADLGAYKGDTIAILLYLFGKQVKNLVIFEPITDALKYIKEVLNSFETTNLNTYIYPSAVWRETGIKKVKNLGAESYINDEEGELVAVVSLDDTLIGSPINFLKMDIEGAELDALKGGIEFIRKNKPVMAISVYHRPEDLWEIPFFIKENFPFYRFYLRLHGHMLNEIVLYCIPDNR